jgi:hypothetical protein
MIGNCRESVKLTKAQEEHVWRIGKARSRRYYEAKLEPLRVANPKAADWFHDRKEQFATYCFLDHDVPRFGKVTSNGAENTNSAILTIRSLPITAMLVELTHHVIRHAHQQRTKAQQWHDDGKELTEYGISMRLKGMGLGLIGSTNGTMYLQ